ncbi:MAG TPA: LemA family protein [Steroidobacteraceae bacterium]|nr:LemA family protein [Steroidobacteraceae bacterium]
MAWIIVPAIAALALAAAVLIRRGLLRLERDTRAAWDALAAQLGKRGELMTRIVELCGRLMHEEPETLERARMATLAVLAAISRADVPALAAAEEQHRAATGDLLTVAGSYPQLATSTAFAALVARVDELDARVAARREQYNAAASLLNLRCATFPHRLAARALGFRPAGLLA